MNKDIRRERWVVVIALMAACVCGTMFWPLIKSGSIIGWMFGIPFLAAICMGAWYATRDDDYYQKRVLLQRAQINRYKAWKALHPRKAFILEICLILLLSAIIIDSVVEDYHTSRLKQDYLAAKSKR